MKIILFLEQIAYSFLEGVNFWKSCGSANPDSISLRANVRNGSCVISLLWPNQITNPIWENQINLHALSKFDSGAKSLGSGSKDSNLKDRETTSN